MRNSSRDGRLVVPGAAFLVSQVGMHSSQLWRQRMADLGLDHRHVVLLRLVGAEEGRSQLALGNQMGLPPSRMVAFVDELEGMGLLERRADPDDRRVRALYLTDKGRQTLGKVMKVSAEHEKAMTAGLDKTEVEQLRHLLGRVAEKQGLQPGVHPGVSLPESPAGKD